MAKHESIVSHEILQWVDKELSENRTDTVHDILALLAEQMINNNRGRYIYSVLQEGKIYRHIIYRTPEEIEIVERKK